MCSDRPNEPSHPPSSHQGYHGAAVGKGRQLAKTEMEKLKLSELSTREAVLEAARMSVFPSGYFRHHFHDGFTESISFTMTQRRRTSSWRCHGLETRQKGCICLCQKTSKRRRNRRQRQHWRILSDVLTNSPRNLLSCCFLVRSRWTELIPEDNRPIQSVLVHGRMLAMRR